MYGSFEASATRGTAQVLYSPSETYRELLNSLISFLLCSVVGLLYASLKLLHVMLRYSFLCMIMSYVRLLALSVAFCPRLRAHIFIVMHLCLSLRPCQKWAVSGL